MSVLLRLPLFCHIIILLLIPHSHPGVATHISTTVLTATHIVVAYRDDSDNGKGKFWVGNAVTGAQVASASNTFETGQTVDISVSRLTDSKFIVTYSAADEASRGKFWIWDTANGQQVVASTVFNLLPATSIHSVPVNATCFAVVFQDDHAAITLWVGDSTTGAEVGSKTTLYTGNTSGALIPNPNPNST